MMVPAILIVCSIIIFPLIFTTYASFTFWKGAGFEMRFVGIDNYIKIFNDARFLNALKNNAIWIVLYMIFPVVSGFLRKIK